MLAHLLQTSGRAGAHGAGRCALAFPAAAAGPADWPHRPSEAFDVIGGEERRIDRRIIRVKLAWSSSIIQRKDFSKIPFHRRCDVYFVAWEFLQWGKGEECGSDI